MIFNPNTITQVKSFTANLAQAAGTYDLATATGGDVLVDLQTLAIYVATAGATLTSVSIQSNQTNATVILSAVEGAVANLIAQKNLVRAIPVIGGLLLKSGQKLQYTLVGVTGTGSLNVVVPFLSISGSTLV